MAGRISRRKLAQYVADKLTANQTAVIKELAAFLLATKRTRELELIVRDIEAELKDRGVIIADVASAYPLSEAVKKEVTEFIINSSNQSTDKTEVYLRETVDSQLLGGVRIAMAGELFDGTIRHKINALRRAKQS